ncbi:hypothetical protein H5410_038744 [Solanum commersonii]|uniref:Secreted protein n=1 Tax=Solanum commersonii TaxID=4109 RepID=A0A9J5YD59_SOLCO|nr:hypothetical protein H5410_038744 [Solanum commersonii]
MAKAIRTLLFLLLSYFSVSSTSGAFQGTLIALSRIWMKLIKCLNHVVSAGSLTLADGQKTWCVARPSSDEMALQQNLSFACSM